MFHLHGLPKKSHPLAGYRRIGDTPGLGFGQVPKTFVQSALCFLGHRHDFCRDHALAFPKCCTAPGRVRIFPRNRDQSFLDMRISRLRDAAPPRVLSRTVLTGNQSQLGHQRAWMGKPANVTQLGHQRKCCHQTNASERHEGPNLFAVQVGVRHLCQLEHLLFQLCQRKPETVPRDLVYFIHRQSTDPCPKFLAPMTSCSIGKSPELKKCQNLLFEAGDPVHTGGPTTHQGTKLFLLLAGNTDGSQQIAGLHARQLPGISAIRLDPIPRTPGNGRRRNHLAGDALLSLQITGQPVATRRCLLTTTQLWRMFLHTGKVFPNLR